MNPQPPEYVGQLFAIGFVLMVIFYAIKSYSQGKSFTFEDRIIIGYIDEPVYPVSCSVEIAQPKTKKKKKSTTSTTTSTTPTPPPPPPPNDDEPKQPRPFNPPKQLKQNQESTNQTDQLYLDCIDALHSLGLKKSESKKKTKEIFNSNNRPANIQEFLILAFKK